MTMTKEQRSRNLKPVTSGAKSTPSKQDRPSSISDESKETTLVLLDDKDDPHQVYAGTQSPAFNQALINQAVGSIWYGAAVDPATKKQLQCSAPGAMMNIGPKDAIEGMLAAQMVATHNAAMECYRRAMIPEQPLVGRESALNHGNKLSRSYATLVHAFDKHRGRGQQTVRVEHVHVYEGGQAIVGQVSRAGRMDAEPDHQSGIATPGEGKNGD
ncbi:hypothetical protein VQ045_12495 [Aurantimonas sp. E1-2-R+4]|uniref:hypothetical protein n=1 Tax=Aurantimonas sp. E1-2-R+4 TaxID=3113714 RepID=UPI002F91D98E